MIVPTGLLPEFPGCLVYLTAPGTPGRKTKYDLVAVKKENGLLINMDSQAPNKVVKEWLDNLHFDIVIPEYAYGINVFFSRLRAVHWRKTV